MKIAKEKDWKTEYLAPVISVKKCKWSRRSNKSYKQIWFFTYRFYSYKK